jgi:hypothetical protein
VSIDIHWHAATVAGADPGRAQPGRDGGDPMGELAPGHAAPGSGLPMAEHRLRLPCHRQFQHHLRQAVPARPSARFHIQRIPRLR